MADIFHIADGLPVHVESRLQDKAHVFVDAELKYSAVLSLVDIRTNENKYYKMQLLESDDTNIPEYVNKHSNHKVT